ncbi:porin family protein [Chitinophagaceae bacterium LWZ2-11]
MNDDMDDLFRKASDEYPLKESGADWDKIANALQNATGNNTTAAVTKRNDRKKLFWLLLLLPFAWICTQYGGNKKIEETTAGKTITQPTEIEKGKDQQPVNNEQTIPAENSERNNPANSSGIAPNNATAINTASGFSLNRNGRYIFNDRNTGKADIPQPIAQADKSNKEETTGNNVTGITTNADDATILTNKPSSTLAANTNNSIGDTISTINEMVADSTVNKKNIEDKNDIKKDVLGNPDKKNIVLNKKQTKERGFYAGINGSLDISTVKMQAVKKAGWGIGVVAGYQFTKHWAIETGIQWDKKQYYSDGEYFDKTKPNIPTYVTIVDLTGNCNMFEIPLNVHYNFSFSKKGYFFASGGISSYLMKKENYSYWAKTTGPVYHGQRSYDNSGNNWFSIINLSAGYEYKLGKIGNFRIEPYLKIPIKGVGIGSLPITSMGLNVGIIHHFR